jgi:hypothetical protein
MDMPSTDSSHRTPFPLLPRVLGTVLLAAGLPLVTLGATAPPMSAAPAASQPKGPTIGADIASKCNEMSGDERAACTHDTRHAAATRRSHHHPAPAKAASAPGEAGTASAPR